MMKLNLDLGRERSEPCGVPMPTEDASEKYYPSLYLEGIDEMPDLPKEGTMTVRFKRTSKSVNENEEGEEKTSCCLEIQEIVSVDAAKDMTPTKTDRTAANALDALLSEVMKAKE